MASLTGMLSVKKEKLSVEVANQITELILDESLRPGDPLPSQRELAEEIGVSRTVLREAIKTLEERGLVEMKHGSGTYVRRPTSKSISRSVRLFIQTGPERFFQLIDVREILDVEIAARLAKECSEEDLLELEERLALMEEALDSPEEFVRLDVAFHMAFYRATRNEVLMAIMAPITELLMETVGITFAVPGSAERSLKRHQVMLACIRAGDAEGARQAVRETMQAARQRLREGLGGEPGSDAD